jgi:hypothetical protein
MGVDQQITLTWCSSVDETPIFDDDDPKQVLLYSVIGTRSLYGTFYPTKSTDKNNQYGYFFAGGIGAANHRPKPGLYWAYVPDNFFPDVQITKVFKLTPNTATN